MTRLRLETSYWLDGADPRPRPRQALRHDLDADVAVVGGGVTGCAVAYFLAQAGARVVLPEGKRIARGSTAASTALLMQEPDIDFTELTARHGAAAARHVWRAGRAAVTDLHQTPQALHIAAHAHALPSIDFTRDAMSTGAGATQGCRRAGSHPPRSAA